MADEAKTLTQVRDAVVASRADQKQIGGMTIGALKSLTDTLKDGLKFDKKTAQDEKRKDAKKGEQQREQNADLKKTLVALGDSLKDAFKDFGKITEPAGLGKIVFGLVGLVSGVVVAFVAEVSKLFGFIINPFLKVFGKKGIIHTRLRLMRRILNRSKIVQFIKGLFGSKGTIARLFGPKSLLYRFFGKKGLRWFKGLTQSFSALINALSPTLKLLGSGGKLMQFFKPIMGFMKTMFKVGKLFGTVLGKLFLPIQIIGGVISGITAAWSKFAEGDILGGIGAFFGGILDFITFGIIDTEKFTTFFKSLFSNLFGVFEKLFSGDIVGAITSLGNFLLDWMVGLPELVFDGILNAIAGIFNFFGLDSIGNWFSQFAEVDILGTIKGFFASMMEYIGPVIDGIMDTTMSVFGGIYDAFTWVYDNVFIPYITFVKDLFMNIFSGIGNAFTWIYDNVFIPYISPLGDIMMSVFGAIGDGLKFVYNTVINPVISGIMYFFDVLGYGFGMLSYFAQEALNGLIGVVNGILAYVPKTSYMDEFNFAGEMPEFPAFEMLPGLEEGGVVKGLQDGLGKLFRMGEGGDELVTPLDEIKPNILDPIMSKAMAMVPQMQQMAGGAMQAAGNALIVNAPNNSQMVNAPTTMMGAMTTRNADMSRRDMNC